jgi:pectin methylesterase-like acyl-CoA thioesterase
MIIKNLKEDLILGMDIIDKDKLRCSKIINPCTIGEHKITLKPWAVPFISKPYRINQQEQEFLDNKIEQLVREGKLEPCMSVYGSPVVLIPD